MSIRVYSNESTQEMPVKNFIKPSVVVARALCVKLTLRCMYIYVNRGGSRCRLVDRVENESQIDRERERGRRRQSLRAGRAHCHFNFEPCYMLYTAEGEARERLAAAKGDKRQSPALAVLYTCIYFVSLSLYFRFVSGFLSVCVCFFFLSVLVSSLKRGSGFGVWFLFYCIFFLSRRIGAAAQVGNCYHCFY